MKTLIVVGLILNALSGSQESSQPEKQVVKANSTAQTKGTKKTKQDEQSAETKAIQEILGQVAQLQQTNAQILQAQADQKQEDVQINGKLAKYTLALVFVGAIQALILAFTVWVAFQQAGITKNSERAWMMTELNWRDRVRFINTSGTGGTGTYVDLDLICQNDGATPAWISEIRVRFDMVKTMSPVPIFDPAREGDFVELRPIPLTVGGRRELKIDCHCAEAVASGLTKIIYGFVKYRDAFGSNRETRFGYSFSADDALERMGIPEYNKNT